MLEELKINEFAFNEEEMGKAFFLFDNKAIRSVSNTLIEKQTVIELFKLVMKYLYNEYHLSSDEILYYIHRYSVVICYYFTSSLNDERLYNEDLEEILKSPITLESLNNTITGKGLYVTWFNKLKDFKEYNKKFDNLLKSNDIKLKNKIYSISRVGSFEYNFFTPNTELTSFINNDKIRRFDMILAEILAEPNYTKFDFKIDEQNLEFFIKNIIKDTKERRNFSYILMGYLANDLISNENYNYDKPIHLIKSSYLRCMSLKRKASFALNFINKENEELIMDQLTPFEFIYNGQTYKLTKDKIIL